VISQEIDSTYRLPVFNADSLGQLMMNEFINGYNMEDLDYSAILKNRFADFSLYLDYKAKTYYGLGFETLKNPYYLVPSPPIYTLKSARNSIDKYISQFEFEKKLLKKQKRKLDSFNLTDFVIDDVTWNMGTHFGWANTLYLDYVSIDNSMMIQRVSFLVLFNGGLEKDFLIIVQIGKN
jgi:hypothetical protein